MPSAAPVGGAAPATSAAEHTHDDSQRTPSSASSAAPAEFRALLATLHLSQHHDSLAAAGVTSSEDFSFMNKADYAEFNFDAQECSRAAQGSFHQNSKIEL